MTNEDRLNILKKVFNIQKFDIHSKFAHGYSFKINNNKLDFGFGLTKTNKNIVYMISDSLIEEPMHYLEKSNEIIIHDINDVLIIDFVEDFKNIKI